MRRHATRLGLLVAIATLLLVPASEVAAWGSKKIPFRVLTFNVRYDFEDDGRNRWRHRVDLVARTIARSEAHVVCIQEDKEHQVSDLQERLPDRYAFLGRGRNETGTGERCSIAVDRETFSVEDHGDFWLSDTPEVPGSNTWGDRYPRKVTWAHLVPREDDDKDLLVLNTHYPNGRRAQHIREKSAKLMRSWLDERLGEEGRREVAVVVAGDFNSDSEERPHAILTEHDGYRLADAWEVAEPNDRHPGTYGGFEGMTTRSRIDWVLVSGPMRVLGADKLEVEYDGRYPSDHYPVMADLVIR